MPDNPLPAHEGSEAYVFVCYSHQDKAVVYPLINRLRDQGINVWYDEGIEAGTVWRRRLAAAIEGASRMIFFVSSRSIQSVHCNQEIDYAIEKNIGVLPAYLEEVELTPELGLVLNRVQALRFEGNSDHFDQLVEALRTDPVSDLSVTPASLTRKKTSNRLRRFRWLLGGTVAIVFGAISVLQINTHLQPGEISQDEFAPSESAHLIAITRPRAIGEDQRVSQYAQIVEQDVWDATENFPNLVLVDSQSNAEPQYLIGGSIRPSENGVRVSINLKRSSDGVQLWSQAFDETLIATESMEFRRAAHVAYTVNAVLSHIGYRERLEKTGATNSEEALNSFFAGLIESDAARLGDGNYLLVVDHYRKAIAQDPEFTDAYARLALTYAFRGQGQFSLEESLASVETLLPKLASLPPTPAVDQALVYVNLRLRLDYEAAERHLSRLESTSFLPLFQTQWMRCSIHIARGELDKAVEHCSASAASSGGSLEYYILGLVLHVAGRHAQAVEAFQRSLATADNSQLDGEERGVHNNGGQHLIDVLARSQVLNGDPIAATATLDSTLARQLDWYPKEYVASLALIGRREEALEALDQIAPGERFPSKLLWASLYLGNLDDSFYWMRRAIDNMDFFTIGALKSSPLLDELRTDPRFDEVMQRLAVIEANGPVH